MLFKIVTQTFEVADFLKVFLVWRVHFLLKILVLKITCNNFPDSPRDRTCKRSMKLYLDSNISEIVNNKGIVNKKLKLLTETNTAMSCPCFFIDTLKKFFNK